jgi:serine/threonine-protein kinase
VYATGLLLYTLVVGRGPFAHLRDQIELLKANANERPAPPSEKAAQPIPRALDAAILRALEKRPEDRFESAEDFASELRRIVAEMSNEPPPATTTTDPLPEPEERTQRLAGATQLVAADTAAPHTPPLSAASTASPGTALQQGEAQEPRTSARARSGWGTFMVLALLSAAISTIVLLALYRFAAP